MQKLSPSSAGPAGVGARAWRFVSGTRTATWLLVVLGALCVLGMVYPQSSVLSAEQLADWRSHYPLIARTGEALGLDRLFSTWYFATVLGMVAVNSAACTLKRLVRWLRAPAPPVRTPSSWTEVPIPVDADSGRLVFTMRRALSVLPRAVKTTQADDGAVLASGRIGFWGSMVLHLALVLIAAGGVVSALTTFQGRIVIAEGETVVDERGSYASVIAEPVFGSGYTGEMVRLDDLEFVYEGDVLTRTIAHLTRLGPAGATPLTAEVNYPFTLGRKSFLIGRAGYTADVTVTGPLGVSDAVYRLGEWQSTGYGDEIDLPDGVTLELFGVPTRDTPRGQEVVRRYDFRDPALYLRASTGGNVLWEGMMEPGATVRFGDHSVSFRGLGVWNEFNVRADDGRLLVYIGLWAAVLGFAVRIADPDARIVVTWAEGDVMVRCRHRYGRVASERLAARLAHTAATKAGGAS